MYPFPPCVGRSAAQHTERRPRSAVTTLVVVATTTLLVLSGAGHAYGQPDDTTPPSTPGTTTTTQPQAPAPEPPPTETTTTTPPAETPPSTTAPPTTTTPPAGDACAEVADVPPVEEEWTPTPDPNRTVVPGQMRSDCQEVPEPFTKADADKAETMEARLSTARVAAGCQVYWPAPYEVCGVIRTKYNAMGGPNSFLLFPKSNELTNPGNTGKRTEFLGGNIYWSGATGAHPVAHDFLTKWGEKGYEGGFMKYPTTDEIVLSVGINGRRQEFQGGSIYFSAPTGAHNVQGQIRDKWLSLGGPAGDLGFPVTDELDNGFNFYSRFVFGTISWSPDLGVDVIEDPYALANPVDGEKCTIYNEEDCNKTGGLEPVIADMKKCETGTMTDPELVLGVNNSAFYPNLRMTCETYKKIATKHRAQYDRKHFLYCLILTYKKGGDWDRVNFPNNGIKWQNSRSKVWGYISFFPGERTIVTTYTSGEDGADWGGCSRGYFD